MENWPNKQSFFSNRIKKIGGISFLISIISILKIFPFLFDDAYWFFAKHYYRYTAIPKECQNLNLPVRRLKQFDIVKAYPKQALKENIEGYVEMELYIDRIGEVYDVKILKSSPNGIFENNSMKTAKSMVFVPEYKNCQAIPSSYNLTVKFVM